MRCQPRCHPQVCETMCPYRACRWRTDAVSMDDGSCAVTLARDKGDGCLDACVVMYLRHLPLARDIASGMEGEFMRRHVPRLMESCPMRMEHEVYGYNHGRRRKHDDAG